MDKKTMVGTYHNLVHISFFFMVEYKRCTILFHKLHSFWCASGAYYCHSICLGKLDCCQSNLSTLIQNYLSGFCTLCYYLLHSSLKRLAILIHVTMGTALEFNWFYLDINQSGYKPSCNWIQNANEAMISHWESAILDTKEFIKIVQSIWTHTSPLNQELHYSRNDSENLS